MELLASRVFTVKAEDIFRWVFQACPPCIHIDFWLKKYLPVISDVQDADVQQSLMIRGSEIVSEIIDETIMDVIGDETSFELNLGALKVKHTVKREKRKI